MYQQQQRDPVTNVVTHKHIDRVVGLVAIQSKGLVYPTGDVLVSAKLTD